MTGKDLRLNKLFTKGENAVIVAIDHGMFDGPIPGMIDLKATVKKINPCYIIWIETPNMQISEYGIPGNKNKSYDNRRKKELLPGFIKIYFGMKRKQERYENGKKVNKKVEESHFAFLIFQIPEISERDP